MPTMTSRAFNQDTGAAKRAAANGPVFITDRGETKHVLMTVEEYMKLKGAQPSLLDALVDDRPEADFEFDPPRIQSFGPRPVDLD